MATPTSPKRRPRTPPHLLEFTQNLSPTPSIGRVPIQRVKTDNSARSSILTSSELNEAPKLLSKDDIDTTIAHLEAPLKTLDTLCTQLDQLGKTWAQFGTEIDQLSKQKGVGEIGKEGLSLWGGVSFLTSVQHEVLSRHVKNSVSKPIEKVVDNYGNLRKILDEEFQLSYHDLVRQLRAAERAQLNLASSKTRNIATYRSSLEELAANLDTIDVLKKQYYGKSSTILEAACTNVAHIGARMVQLQLEMASNMAKKSTNVGGLGHWLNDSFETSDLTIDHLNDTGDEESDVMSDQEFLGEAILFDNSTLKGNDSPPSLSQIPNEEEINDTKSSNDTEESAEYDVGYKSAVFPAQPPQSPIW